MIKLLDTLSKILLRLLAIAGIVMGFVLLYRNCPELFIKDEKVVIDNDSSDLKLPGEVEKTRVTVEQVEVKLNELSEFSTYSGEYNATIGKEQTRYFLEKLKVPFTSNNLTIKCKGVVKVGYDFSKVTVKIDNDKIYIFFPPAQVNDNYIMWDTIECEEDNNFLNPIEFLQYQDIINEIEAKGLEQVEEEEIYDKARENMIVLMKAFMSEFEGYEVECVFSQ